jgi:hypothetical protein
MSGKDLVERASGGNAIQPREMKVLSLNDPQGLNVSNLDVRQIAELEQTHARNMVDLERKAGEAKIALGKTKGKLDTYSDIARKATQEGFSTTISNVLDDELGRTEIVIGNTDSAKNGKLSLFQRGSSLPMMALIAVALIAVVAIFALSGHR